MVEPDTQISGVVDDGSESGSIRARIVRGEIVSVPFHPYKFATEVVGASGMAYNEGLLTAGEDGYGNGINFVVGAFVETGTGARATFPFYGPILGVQILRTSSVPLDKLSIGVDGMYFPVRGFHEFLTSRGYVGVVDAWGYAIAVDDLPDLPAGRSHIGEIVLTSSPGVGNSVTIQSFLVAKSAGYKSPPPRTAHPFTVALTNAAVAVPKGTAGEQQGRSIRKIVYYNADTVTRTVQLKIGATIVDKLSLATLTRGEFDFGDYAATPSTLTHQAGEANTTNPVQATVWYGV